GGVTTDEDRVAGTRLGGPVFLRQSVPIKDFVFEYDSGRKHRSHAIQTLAIKDSRVMKNDKLFVSVIIKFRIW
ncbi:MAG: hypothetical protein ACYCT0_05175, partial [Sulfobacillus sp.]